MYYLLPGFARTVA